MKKRINLLALANAVHSVYAYHRIVVSLEKNGYDVKFVGLSPRRWNESKTDHVGCAFGELKYKYQEIPRTIYRQEKLTTGKNYKNQFKKSIKLIISFIKNIQDKEKIDVFIADSDRHIPILISKYLAINKIPTVLIDHGLGNGFIYPHIYKNVFRKKIIDIFRLLIYKLPAILKRKNDFEDFCGDLRVKLFGENGKYFICSFCRINSGFFQKFGIDKKNIFETGYPYFDEVYDNVLKIDKSDVNHYHKLKKILFVSSGFGIWNKEIKNDFYENAIYFKKKYGKGLNVFLRLKQGENIRKQFSQMKFDDNRILSYKAVQKYDLIVGDASMVLLEAIAFSRPVIVLRNKKAVLVDEIVDEVWKKYLDVIIVKNIDELRESLNKALSLEYRKSIYDNFLKYKQEILNGFDGKASERVAKVILKAVWNPEAKS